MAQRAHIPEEFTLSQSRELAEAMIPRFREAIAPDLAALREEMKGIAGEIATLKARSGLWGALGGVLTALLAILSSHR